MISLHDYRTEDALPAEMKTPERLASCRVFDIQKKKFMERLRRVYIWADLDKVEDDKLDFLAVESRVLFYNTSLSPEIKRSLIRNSIYWYMKLGTSQAMTEMIDTVFGDNNTSVEEWYTYAGAPFHFRIAVGTEVTQTSIKEFLNYLNKVKNARSRFDYMAFQNGITLKFFDKSEYQTFFYTFCGDFECGTYPAAAVGFIPTEVQLSLEAEGEEAFAEYTPAGTTPDISTGLHLSEVTVDLEGATDGQTIVYPTDSGPVLIQIRRPVLCWRKAAFPSRLKVKDLTYIMTAPRRNTPRTKNERRSKQHDRRKLYSFNGRSNRRREGISEKGCRLRGIPFREYLDKNSDRPCGNFIRWPDRDLCYVRS